jgi:hypothetical protein
MVLTRAGFGFPNRMKGPHTKRLIAYSKYSYPPHSNKQMKATNTKTQRISPCTIPLATDTNEGSGYVVSHMSINPGSWLPNLVDYVRATFTPQLSWLSARRQEYQPRGTYLTFAWSLRSLWRQSKLSQWISITKASWLGNYPKAMEDAQQRG